MGARQLRLQFARTVFAAGLCTVLIACSTPGQQEVGTLTARLDRTIRDAVADGNAPSVQIAVVASNEIVWSKAYGENTSVDHVYMNASVQKSLTAAAILQLAERRLLSLDTDVSEYVPFSVRHPGFPEYAITTRMLLAHRSGLGDFPYQFEWDTESAFAPLYRPPAPAEMDRMSLEEFLTASLTPDGANYEEQSWTTEPGQEYRYSVSAYPFLRFLIAEVSGESYPDYMRDNFFGPLGMTGSGFTADKFSDRHATPYTRIDGQNIEISRWNGRGFMMHTTASDMARFLIALINDGKYADFELLQPETIALMRRRTTRFKVLFQRSDDLPRSAHGLGLFAFRGGWFGNGGSAPGYQCLMRYNPSGGIGFVVLANVNAILAGGHNYETARKDLYDVQHAILSVLDPRYAVRIRAAEAGIVAALVLYVLTVGYWAQRRRRSRGAGNAT
jgi:CubicO group peptidase (beta-lactamase class C family)